MLIKNIMHNSQQYFLWILLIIIVIILFCAIRMYWSQQTGTDLTDQQSSMSYRCKRGQQLWDDHFYLTRLYIVSAMRNGSGTNATAQRLLLNQDQLGQLYNSTQLGTLLQEHINIAVLITNSVLQNKGIPNPTYLNQWKENANQIGILISQLTGLSVPEAQAMMQNHLNLTAAELLAEYQCSTGNSNACVTSVNNGDLALQQIREMSDHLCGLQTMCN